MKRTKEIAPRLANGDMREDVWLSLPEAYKEGWRKIAQSEGKSVSWCIQQILIDFCHGRLRIALPRYVKRKVKAAPRKGARILKMRKAS